MGHAIEQRGGSFVLSSWQCFKAFYRSMLTHSITYGRLGIGDITQMSLHTRFLDNRYTETTGEPVDEAGLITTLTYKVSKSYKCIRHLRNHLSVQEPKRLLLTVSLPGLNLITEYHMITRSVM